MSNITQLTPEQIEEVLRRFFDLAGTRQYIGARYVPLFGRRGEPTIEWDNLKPYEPLTIVLHQGNSYTSRQYVPVGVAIDNQEYWANTGNYNAQIEQYRLDLVRAIEGVNESLTEFSGEIGDVKNSMPASAFSPELTIKGYIDARTDDIADRLPSSEFGDNNTVKDYVDDNKLPYPTTDKYGSDGQVLGTNLDGTTKWQDPVTVTDAQAETYITSWLNAHPEATTTVTDGSIDAKKLHESVRNAIAIANAFSSGVFPGAIALPYIITSTGIYDNNSSNKHILIPNMGFSTLRFKSSSVAGVYAFLTADTYGANVSAPFCTGTSRVIVNNDSDSRYVDIPADCEYIYIAYLTNGGSSNVLPEILELDHYDVLSTMRDYVDSQDEELHQTINDELFGYDLNAHSAPYLINSGGTWSDASGLHVCIPLTHDDIVRIIGNASYTGVYTFLTDDFYYSNMSAFFCSGITGRTEILANYDTGNITPPADCKYLYIAYLNSTHENISPQTIYVNGVDILKGKISQESTDANWLANIVSMSTNKSIIHFSLDDISAVFGDLITNQNVYPSVWDCPDMAKLKNLHDSTGLCITLNCFVNYGGNNMLNLPEIPTWQTELQAAKTWLRFAFHAEDDSHYTGASMLADYNDFVTGVYKFTGSYDCIDRITRLGYFEGTTQNLAELKGATPSLIGFLTADESGRLSYDFDSTQAAFLWKHGKWFDEDRELIFIRSFLRADNSTAQTVIDQVESFIPSACDIVEIFGHNITTALFTKFEDISTWANNNGFYNYFPMDIYS